MKQKTRITKGEGNRVASTTRSTGKADENKMAVLRALNLRDGKVVSVRYESDSTLAGENGNALSFLPPRTIVQTVFNPAPGSNIRVEVWLPNRENWNGRFLGIGNGGAAGNINPVALAWPIYAGYAVASTDMGTAPDANSGIGNAEVWKDFGYRATHLATVAGKEIVKAFYGRDPAFSYFTGGSTGGQQALQEAQRYPEDYDGIVANVPAHCRTPLHAYFLWNAQILNRCPFTETQQESIIRAANEYMSSREISPTAGMLVSDPRCNSTDIESVIELARQKDRSLTGRHVNALRQLFGGPVRPSTGERIFCGIPLGASFNPAHGNLYLFNWVFGEDCDLMKLDFEKDIDAYTAALGPYLNAENADLSRFAARGGKLIIVSGSADSCVPYTATLDYYERVVEHCGSLEKAQEFSRFYMIPGMGHGLGDGPGINKMPSLLDILVDWRENSVAPGAIQAQRIVKGRLELDLPVYPYPIKTFYSVATGYKAVAGPRAGVEPVARRYTPPASGF